MTESELSDDEVVKLIEEKINTVGKTGRYVTWFADIIQIVV